ncbi:hypothetical protein BJ684DRAFT_19176 [Piptocephalis cylindrospora]|uniref:C2 DOCK-type domain-containing protein n=1 Tax=Piptocephalis cylindrospora TaxID=1907219 RepID=A0A4P9Y6U9_9FUNG|nr:hypothetical protein BJ684DRAFT_19176 [Piptocephalis cylindrospora]|eukprot:RKP14424.1 hypothetical protein BJ684DRAFT_19176 [Piptocephalis cylindrospora]
MPWKPLPRLAYAVAVYPHAPAITTPFTPLATITTPRTSYHDPDLLSSSSSSQDPGLGPQSNGPYAAPLVPDLRADPQHPPHQVPLDVGDHIVVLERSGAWYRGYVLPPFPIGSAPRLGIFPANHVELRAWWDEAGDRWLGEEEALALEGRGISLTPRPAPTSLSSALSSLTSQLSEAEESSLPMESTTTSLDPSHDDPASPPSFTAQHPLSSMAPGLKRSKSLSLPSPRPTQANPPPMPIQVSMHSTGSLTLKRTRSIEAGMRKGWKAIEYSPSRSLPQLPLLPTPATAQEEPLVETAAHTLRAWCALLQRHLRAQEYGRYEELRARMAAILEGRRQLLGGTALSSAGARRVRRAMVRELAAGSRSEGRMTVVRGLDGRVGGKDPASPLHLYKQHVILDVADLENHRDIEEDEEEKNVLESNGGNDVEEDEGDEEKEEENEMQEDVEASIYSPTSPLPQPPWNPHLPGAIMSPSTSTTTAAIATTTSPPFSLDKHRSDLLSLRSRRPGRDQIKQGKESLEDTSTEEARAYHLFVDIQAVVASIARPGESGELSVQLYHHGRATFLSEPWVIPLTDQGMPQDGALIGRVRALFLSLTPTEIREATEAPHGGDLYLVVRVVRRTAGPAAGVGPGMGGSTLPTSGISPPGTSALHGGDPDMSLEGEADRDSGVTSGPAVGIGAIGVGEGVRRPFGLGLVPLGPLIAAKVHGVRGGGREGWDLGEWSVGIVRVKDGSSGSKGSDGGTMAAISSTGSGGVGSYIDDNLEGGEGGEEEGTFTGYRAIQEAQWADAHRLILTKLNDSRIIRGPDLTRSPSSSSPPSQPPLLSQPLGTSSMGFGRDPTFDPFSPSSPTAPTHPASPPLSSTQRKVLSPGYVPTGGSLALRMHLYHPLSPPSSTLSRSRPPPGDVQTLIRAHPELLSGKVPLVGRLGFPDAVGPGEERHQMYITLEGLDFSVGLKRTPRHVQVRVQIRDTLTGQVLPRAVSRGAGTSGQGVVDSLVLGRMGQPRWQETIRVDVPHGRFPGCHLLFLIRQVASTEGGGSGGGEGGSGQDGGEEKVLSWGWLPLARPVDGGIGEAALVDALGFLLLHLRLFSHIQHVSRRRRLPRFLTHPSLS